MQNINQKNRVNLFGYYSRDRASLVNQTTFEYENIGASLSWLHSFNRRAEFSLSFDYCLYGFREQNSELLVSAYDLNYKLNHTAIKLIFELYCAVNSFIFMNYYFLIIIGLYQRLPKRHTFKHT